MRERFGFSVFCHPEPQGSAKAFIQKGRAIVTSDNKKLKPFRQEVTQTAILEVRRAGFTTPIAGKHEPVTLSLVFVFNKPPSAPKRREYPAVKPDLDKLTRATMDALTGVLFLDDAQVVCLDVSKEYGEIEQVRIGMFSHTTAVHQELSR